MIGVCGEVLPSLKEDLRALGLNERQVLDTIERMQKSEIQGTSRLEMSSRVLADSNCQIMANVCPNSWVHPVDSQVMTR